jgi:DNA polymerase-3 subunit delta'
LVEDILGHERNIAFLRRAVAGRRVAHAYLFYGPAGVGKATVARMLAAMLLCPQGRAGKPCGACEDCHMIARGQHPDWYHVVPAGATIKIEQVRHLQQILLRRPWRGRYRVCVMAHAEAMSTEAANCLLKTLEEPPAATVFILTSDRWHDLPPTVVSRCQRLRFDALPVEAVASWLVERHGIDEQRAGLVAHLACGSPGRALELAGNPDLEEMRSRVVDTLRELPAMSVWALLRRAAELAEGGREAADFCIGLLLWWYRDLAVWRLTRQETYLRNRDCAEQLQAQALDTAGLMACIAAVTEARRQLRAFASPRLVMEVLLLRLAEVMATDGATGSGGAL